MQTSIDDSFNREVVNKHQKQNTRTRVSAETTVSFIYTTHWPSLETFTNETEQMQPNPGEKFE